MPIYRCKHCCYVTTWIFCFDNHTIRHKYVPYTDCRIPFQQYQCSTSTLKSQAAKINMTQRPAETTHNLDHTHTHNLDSIVSPPKINSVDFLLTNKTLTHKQRLEIKLLGRPVPDLKITKTEVGKSRVYARYFNRNVYDKFEWICGCPIRNKLFCFICLVMGGDQSVWTKGFSNLKHLSDQTKRHAGCNEKHLHNTLDFSVLGKIGIKLQLDSAYRDHIRHHNENVDKNRDILNRVIDCIKFCGAFELALRGHDETEHSNPGVFLGLVDFSSELDLVIKEHLTKITVLCGNSQTIQKELLDAMLQVCRNEIKNQVQSSTFLSIQADEITNVGDKQQIVIVFRYVNDGVLTERFWGFVKPEGPTAQHSANAILGELEAVGAKPRQLVAQCFDGAFALRGQRGGVQTQIKEKFPQAYFVHCYAHRLDLVIKKAASMNKKVKIFFSNLDAFISFFSSSAKRTELLDSIAKRSSRKKTPSCWDFNSRTLNTVYEHKDTLIECLEMISNLANDTKTINEATGLLNYLRNDEFLFWLNIFYRVMPHVDVLCCHLQSRTATGPHIETCLTAFETQIERVKSELSYIDYAPATVGTASKRPRYAEGVGDNRITVAKEVLDVIVSQLKDRFAFTDHLSLSNLLARDNFISYKAKIPQDFNTSVDCYDFFDTGKLRTELSTIYKRDDMVSMEGVSALLSFLKENNLEVAFSEIYKLCNLVATIPMTTSESQRCFPTLKRVGTFLRNTVSQDRLTALAMLSVEKKLVKQIRDFNEKVINIFVNSKDRRADFLYK